MNIKSLSKTIANILVVIFFISNLSTIQVFAIEQKGSSYALKTLVSLGVAEKAYLDETPNKIFVSRAEFVKMSVRALGFIDNEKQYITNNFKDVPVEYWANGYISLATNLSLISGMESGMFYPESNITYEQAVKILVSMIGMDIIANQKGGYPVGYLTVASDKKILGRTQITDFKEPATLDIIAQMFYNTMNVEVLQRTNFKTSEFQIKNGETLLNNLTAKLELVKITGRVTSNYYTSLFGKGTNDYKYVIIDNENYDIGLTNADEYLGQYVECYIKDRTIISVIPSENKNKFITLMSEDILRVDERVLYYDTLQSNHQQKLYIEPGFSFIYNGKKKESFNYNDIHRKNGYVKLLDSDNNSEYDVIYVYDYDSFVVASVDTEKKRIETINKQTNKKGIIVLEDENINIAYAIKDEVLNNISLEEVHTDDVISVLISEDKTLINIIKSSSVVEGDINEIYGEEKKIKIDNKAYKIGSNRFGESYLSDLRISQNGKFYFDYLGFISDFEEEKNEQKRFGYVVGIEGVGAFSSKLDLKILSGGYFKEEVDEFDTKATVLKMNNTSLDLYDITGSIKINGQTCNTDKVKNHVKTGDIIEYVSEGTTVKEIKTLNINGIMNERNLNISHKVFGGTAGAPFIFDESTVFFCVPNAPKNDDDYYTMLELRDTKAYSAIGFEIDEETKTVPVVLLKANMQYDIPGAVNSNNSLFLVDKVNYVIDEEGEATKRIYGLYKNKYESFFATDTISNSNIVKSLSRGDAIRISIDSKNRINSMELVANIDGEINKNPMGMHINVRDDKEQIFGSVVSYKTDTLGEFALNIEDIVSIDVLGENKKIVINKDKRPPIYIFDRKANKVLIGTREDVISLENLNGSTSETKIYLIISYNTVKGFIIIKQ